MAFGVSFLKGAWQRIWNVRELTQQSQPELFMIYTIGLRRTWLGLRATLSDTPEKIEFVDLLFKKIEDAHENWDSLWRHAWEIEQFFAGYISEPELVVEAERRLFEADKIGMPSTVHFKQKWNDSLTIQDAKQRLAIQRSVYVNILDDLHWNYGKRNLDRQVKSSITVSIGRVAILLILVAILPFVPWFNGQTLGSFIFSTNVQSGQSHFYGIYLASTFGLLGALFSRLLYLQSHYKDLDYDELVTSFRVRVLIIRLIVGMIGSLVIFYAILGNLLSGDLFPKLVDLTFDPMAKPEPNLAKLIIWAFLGGFSERLVPDFLARTEANSAKPSSAS